MRGGFKPVGSFTPAPAAEDHKHGRLAFAPLGRPWAFAVPARRPLQLQAHLQERALQGLDPWTLNGVVSILEVTAKELMIRLDPCPGSSARDGVQAPARARLRSMAPAWGQPSPWPIAAPRIARHRHHRNQLEQGAASLAEGATDSHRAAEPAPRRCRSDGQCHLPDRLGPRSRP